MSPQDELKYIRFKQRFANFEKARAKFDEYSRLDTEHDEVARSALSQAFEFTFDLAWKCMKNMLESEKKISDDIVFPRDIIKEAFNAKYIPDQNVWTSALDYRNESSHAYDEKLAIKLEEFIRLTYAPALRSLYEHFKQSFNK